MAFDSHAESLSYLAPVPSASLRALLCGSIDYAGLFPPASLTLEPALRNHAAYVRSPDAWMLGAFILPTAKFEETAANLSQFDAANRLRISALGARPDKPSNFAPALAAAKNAIVGFKAQHGESASVEQFEMPLPRRPEHALIDQADAALAGLKLATFWESPADDAERAIELLAQHNAKSGTGVFGYKLRTGGVIASAFPSSIQIARALVAVAKHRVPIKFTAGLHHPVRQFHASVQTKMHGFLNVLGAGVLAAEHGWDQQQIVTMLEDEDASSFVFTGDSFSWCEWKVGTESIARGRKLVTSLGSCSFDEPRDDLRALKLL
ncbi:MAG: hypothetical protein ABI871_06460 [Chthoniobacterales bacterium]